jgi:hypothetical protein
MFGRLRQHKGLLMIIAVANLRGGDRQGNFRGAFLRAERDGTAHHERWQLHRGCTLVMLPVCKWLAYGVSLGSFRGGPTFPAMFLGAAGGMALSHLPGLPLVPGVAMGIGAMAVVMLTLPLTSVLLAMLLLASDGLAVMPLVVVAVVVAYVASARILPHPATDLAGSEQAGSGPPADTAVQA